MTKFLNKWQLTCLMWSVLLYVVTLGSELRGLASLYQLTGGGGEPETEQVRVVVWPKSTR